MIQTNPRLIIILILYSLCSCTVFTSTEKHKLEEIELTNFILKAKALEDEKKYLQAAREYGKIVEIFPSSRYYIQALHKAAYLSVHPENQQFDFNSSLHWFDLLLDTSGTAAEKERVRMHIFYLERIRKLADQIAELDTHNKYLMLNNQKHVKKSTEKNQQYLLLQAEVSRIKQELKKMKEVDILLHKSRTTK